jgi:hypothetical protein
LLSHYATPLLDAAAFTPPAITPLISFSPTLLRHAIISSLFSLLSLFSLILLLLRYADAACLAMLPYALAHGALSSRLFFFDTRCAPLRYTRVCRRC